MALPAAHLLITPIVRTVSETQGLTIKEIAAVVAAKLKLSDADLAPLRPGVKRKQSLFDFRIQNVVGELQTADWLELDGKALRLGGHGRAQLALGLPHSFRCLRSYPPYADDWDTMGVAGFDDDGVTIFRDAPEEPIEPPDIDELTADEIAELRDITPPDHDQAHKIGMEIVYGAINLLNGEMAGHRAVLHALIASHPAPAKLYAELSGAAERLRDRPIDDAVSDEARAAALSSVLEAQALMRDPVRR
ncbi:hypothetical protein [Nevskia sp.]|uniref:hypothetical protein n=1 Tax=Nevskia sp. TaxID=1929292 RepID=UPI0025E28370|nr:hypothetical protein [Nevskia sp.]